MFFRKYWFPLSFLLVCGIIVAIFFTLQPRPKEPVLIVKPVEVERPPAKAPVGNMSQGGHWHGDEWHADPHEPVEQQPTAEVSEPEPPPAYIYDPDAEERPDGWDPELVIYVGGKTLDFNYRPLDEEEQAQYDHLKATENPEHYGEKWEAGLRIVAISNIKQKRSPAFMKSLEADMLAGKSLEYRLKRLREFNGIFAD